LLWHEQLWENTKDEGITKNDTLGQWETMNDDREQWANNFIKKG
jgi:hypothetical protein